MKTFGHETSADAQQSSPKHMLGSHPGDSGANPPALRDTRYKEWSHPGKWELNEQDGLFAWSCCMHYSENSKGCEYTTVNPDKWSAAARL